MVAQEELKRLAERKLAILAESDVIRAGLRESWQDIAAVSERWTSHVQQFRGPKLMLTAGAALAGLFLARKYGKGVGFAAKMMAGWRLFSTARDLWRNWQSSREASL